MSTDLLTTLSQPLAGVTFPSSPAVTAALTFVEAHTIPSVFAHVIRSAYFALIIATKLPSLAHISKTLVVLAALMHDLGWDPSGELVTPDRRFEVDGANAARAFLQGPVYGLNATNDLNATAPGQGWHFTEHQLQLVWDSIALHTTTSIAMHKQPEVAGTSAGVFADFLGPSVLGGGVLTPDEWRAVVKAFPLGAVQDDVTGILVGLCQSKPNTTYDNFVSEFGEKYLAGFSVEGRQEIDVLEEGLKGLAQYEV